MPTKPFTTLAGIFICAMTMLGCNSSTSTTDITAPTEPGGGTPEIEDPTTTDSQMLNPVAEVGSDTDRLLKGIQRQVANTLTNLNTKLRQGETLSQQQEECLGSFDPALGEQLLTINCEQSLATSPSIIRVKNASYYRTDACQSSLSANNTNNCLIQSAQLSIPTEWVTPDGDGGPTPIPQPIAGLEIYYAINGTELRIENSTAALTGVFRCNLELTTVSAIRSSGQSCSTIIANAANRFDALIPGT